MHSSYVRRGALALLTLSVLTPGAFVSAQGTGTTPPPEDRPLRAFLNTMQDRREDRRDDRQEVKTELEDIRKDALDDKKQLHAETRDAFKSATTSDERRDVLRGALGDRLNIIKDRIASTTAVKRDALKDIVERHFGMSRERFAIALRQLDNLLERIENRIAKMQSEGINTSSANTALTEAKTAIATAKADVASLASLIEGVKNTDDTSTVREQIQAATKKAVESVKSAQKELKDVVRILLDIGKQNRDTATTTSAN